MKRLLILAFHQKRWNSTYAFSPG